MYYELILWAATRINVHYDMRWTKTQISLQTCRAQLFKLNEVVSLCDITNFILKIITFLQEKYENTWATTVNQFTINDLVPVVQN